MNNATENEIVRKYTTELQSRDSLAKAHKVPTSQIKALLIRRGITFRSRSEVNTRFTKNDGLFSVIDTEEKAYWLGFLYADGCITRGKMLTVTLAILDHALLKRLSHLIYGTDRTRVYGTKGRRVFPVCQLNVMSRQMFADLNRLGCTPRKTRTLRFPTSDQVPNHLLRHFIRGYFDGDGTIVLQATNSGLLHAMVSFESTKEFCDEALTFLRKEASVTGSITDLAYYTTAIDRLNIVRNLDVVRIYNLFYTDATVFLGRKQEKFETFFRSNADRFHRTDWMARSWRDLGKDKYAFIPKGFG